MRAFVGFVALAFRAVLAFAVLLRRPFHFVALSVLSAFATQWRVHFDFFSSAGSAVLAFEQANGSKLLP